MPAPFLPFEFARVKRLLRPKSHPTTVSIVFCLLTISGILYTTSILILCPSYKKRTCCNDPSIKVFIENPLNTLGKAI